MLIYDRAEMNNSKRVFTDEGYLIIPAKIARSGFYDYTAGELGLEGRDPNEQLVIYRDPKEVFNKDSMKSFALKPVTNNHPPELVNIDNIKQYQKGISGENVIKDADGDLSVPLTFTDKAIIKDIESGKCEVSNGYTAEVTMKKGFAEGREYDGTQTDIKGNHIAIVEAGRAGRQCRLSDNKPNKTKGDKDVKKVIIDGVSIDMTEQGAEVVGKLQGSIAQLTDNLATMDAESKTAIAGLKTENQKVLDTMQAKLDDAESKVVTDAQMAEAVERRSKLVADSKTIFKALDESGKTNAEIMKEVVESKKINCADKSDDYILARFEGLLDSVGTMTDGSENFKMKKKEDMEEEEDDEDKAKNKQVNDSENRWKKNRSAE